MTLAAQGTLALANPTAPFEVIEEKAPFAGYLFRPKTDRPMPGIVFLHGSEGGNGDFWKYPGFSDAQTGKNSSNVQLAKYYASQGYVAYALCYFDCRKQPGFSDYQPDELINVDLMKVYQSYLWLKHSSFVSDKAVFLWGGSRGAEAAILLASLVGESIKSGLRLAPIDGVLSLFTSDRVAPGFSLEDAKRINQGLPPLPFYKNAWKFQSTVPSDTPIKIENSTSLTLIFYGAKDEIWGPSVQPYNLVKRYQLYGIPNFFRKFANHEDLKEAFNTISSHLDKKIVVEFSDEGHFPERGTASEKLMFSLISKFLKLNQ
jgi:pimeloyl-ACP methyl ester carboxylesterase